MRAVTVTDPGGVEQLHLTDRATPEPAPGEVLVRVVAAGVNRADLLQRQGHYPPPAGASDVLGLECSGYLAALGPETDAGDWTTGDTCLALLAGGGYAEQVAVPVGQLLRPPAGVDLVSAAGLVEVAATVVSNADLGALGAGDLVLVHGGAGGIGSMAVQYAKALGAAVATTAGSPDKLDYCSAIGADLAISYRDDWVAAVRELSGGRGVDVVIDVMGGRYLADHIGLLAVGGRLVVIGLQGGRQGTLDLGRLLAVRGQVIATTLRSRPVAEKAAICRRVEEAVWPLVTAGSIAPAPQTRFPLAEVSAAHAQLESGDNLGKIILTVSTP